MKLITLEGLPGSCEEILRNIQQHKACNMLSSSSLAPTSTSSASTKEHAVELARIFRNRLSRLQTLRKLCHIDLNADRKMACGAYWHEMIPPELEKHHQALHQLLHDLEKACAVDLDLNSFVTKHVIIYISMSPHECFERMLFQMEARDLTLHDIFKYNNYLETLIASEDKHTLTPFEISDIEVHTLKVPQFLADNLVDSLVVASKIIALIQDGL
jgi:hypothetical protein